MVKVGIIGSTGCAGGELARLLPQRGDIEIKWYGSRSHIGQSHASLYQNMFRIVDVDCMDDNMKELVGQVGVISTTAPQGLRASLVDKGILSKVKVIDLSTDFRIKDVAVYEKWYKLTHGLLRFIEEAVYGLPEIDRGKIKKARIITNPGCLPARSFLPAYPLVKGGLIDPNILIIDVKSGISGAGRGVKVDSLYCEVNGNIKAYSVGSHGHTPEIEEQLSHAEEKPVTISFTPHLVFMNRRILVTAYVSLTGEAIYEQVRAAYDKYYKEEYFARMLDRDVVSQTRWVEESNFADVNFKIDPRTDRIAIVGAIDNMAKGVAGQTVQSMNLMFGLPENTGFKQIPTLS